MEGVKFKKKKKEFASFHFDSSDFFEGFCASNKLLENGDHQTQKESRRIPSPYSGPFLHGNLHNVQGVREFTLSSPIFL